MPEDSQTKQPFARQAALLCLLPPILTIGMNMVVLGADREHHGAPIVGYLSLAFLLLGPIFGVVALLGIRRHGAQGILGRALVGMGLSAACWAGVAFVAVLASRGALPGPEDIGIRKQLAGTWQTRCGSQSDEKVTWLRLSPDGTYQFRTTGSAVANFSGGWSVQNGRLYLRIDKLVDGRRIETGEKLIWMIAGIAPEKLTLGDTDGQVAYTKLATVDQKSLEELDRQYLIERSGIMAQSTWVGAVEFSGARVALMSYNDNSPLVAEFRSAFSMPVSLLQLAVDNSAGAGDLSIPDDSAKLFKGEVLVATALPPEKVLETARENADAWRKKFSGNIVTGAGQKCVSRVFFLPAGTKMTDVTAVVVTINGVATTIDGRMVTAEELQEMYRQGLEAQKGQGTREGQAPTVEQRPPPHPGRSGADR